MPRRADGDGRRSGEMRNWLDCEDLLHDVMRQLATYGFGENDVDYVVFTDGAPPSFMTSFSYRASFDEFKSVASGLRYGSPRDLCHDFRVTGRDAAWYLRACFEDPPSYVKNAHGYDKDDTTHHWEMVRWPLRPMLA